MREENAGVSPPLDAVGEDEEIRAATDPGGVANWVPENWAAEGVGCDETCFPGSLLPKKSRRRVNARVRKKETL